MIKFTLKDRLVQESLKAVSNLNREQRDFSLVQVGGFAVQLYCPDSTLYRPTNDVDLMCSSSFTFKEFKEKIGTNIKDFLEKKGYVINFGKNRYGYEIGSSEDSNYFLIHVTKFAQAYLERHSKWKKREFKNARERKIREIGDNPVLVHRIEDVMANKARRIRKLKTRGHVFGGDLTDWESFLNLEFEKLGNRNLHSTLQKLLGFREELIAIKRENFSDNLTKIEEYKVKKDLYDLSVLSKAILEGEEFDKEYFKNALPTTPVPN